VNSAQVLAISPPYPLRFSERLGCMAVPTNGLKVSEIV